MGSLVGVEHLRGTIALQGLFERFHVECAVSIVFGTHQESTLCVAQSMTAIRYMKPRAIGI